MNLQQATAYGQRLANLYGWVYYIYPTSEGRYMATPNLGWTPTVMPIYVACHNVVAECYPWFQRQPEGESGAPDLL